MDVETAVVDTLDPRLFKKAANYALGTAMEGLALGLFLPVFFPAMSNTVRLGAAAVLFVVGAVSAVSSYSSLKRKSMIVERSE